MTAFLTFRVAQALTPELVNYVVCNAFLQKAPEGFPKQRADSAFQEAFAAAHSSPEVRKRFLEVLFEVSQKLEKVQRLSGAEAEELLQRVVAIR